MMSLIDNHSLPEGSRPQNAIRNNGPDWLVLERYKLRELAEGWPMYRDACEWENFRSIFHPEAFVYTTWTGRISGTDFIAASQRGMDTGAFIMHRCHGCSSDINLEGTRAVTKMKATITQRFSLQGNEADVESDCRFCFFWERSPSGDWGARYVRHWYEKDKIVPINPSRIPILDESVLAEFPSGYRYLAYCQEEVLGVKVRHDLPGHRREKTVEGGNRASGESHDQVYWQCKDWVEGRDVDI